MTKLVKICALGSVNLDMVIQTQSLPRAGETVTQGVFTSLPGGKGANTALAARRLGATVELRAAVGDDDYARQALSLLAAEGVNLSKLTRLDDTHTGLAFINISADGENQISVASGANGELSAEGLEPIHADAIITQFEIPMATIETVLSKFEGFVCINASPVLPGLERLIVYADLIIVNEGEYKAYKETLKPYAGLLAITLGGAGARLLENGKVIEEAKPPKVDVVDTTGAGDAFAAALTLALVEGQSREEALAFACAVGALTATKLGAQPAAPYRVAVEKLLG